MQPAAAGPQLPRQQIDIKAESGRRPARLKAQRRIIQGLAAARNVYFIFL